MVICFSALFASCGKEPVQDPTDTTATPIETTAPPVDTTSPETTAAPETTTAPETIVPEKDTSDMTTTQYLGQYLAQRKEFLPDEKELGRFRITLGMGYLVICSSEHDKYTLYLTTLKEPDTYTKLIFEVPGAIEYDDYRIMFEYIHACHDIVGGAGSGELILPVEITKGEEKSYYYFETFLGGNNPGRFYPREMNDHEVEAIFEMIERYNEQMVDPYEKNGDEIGVTDMWEDVLSRESLYIGFADKLGYREGTFSEHFSDYAEEWKALEGTWDHDRPALLYYLAKKMDLTREDLEKYYAAIGCMYVPEYVYRGILADTLEESMQLLKNEFAFYNDGKLYNVWDLYEMDKSNSLDFEINDADFDTPWLLLYFHLDRYDFEEEIKPFILENSAYVPRGFGTESPSNKLRPIYCNYVDGYSNTKGTFTERIGNYMYEFLKMEGKWDHDRPSLFFHLVKAMGLTRADLEEYYLAVGCENVPEYVYEGLLANTLEESMQILKSEYAFYNDGKLYNFYDVFEMYKTNTFAFDVKDPVYDTVWDNINEYLSVPHEGIVYGEKIIEFARRRGDYEGFDDSVYDYEQTRNDVKLLHEIDVYHEGDVLFSPYTDIVDTVEYKEGTFSEDCSAYVEEYNAMEKEQYKPQALLFYLAKRMNLTRDDLEKYFAACGYETVPENIYRGILTDTLEVSMRLLMDEYSFYRKGRLYTIYDLFKLKYKNAIRFDLNDPDYDSAWINIYKYIWSSDYPFYDLQRSTLFEFVWLNQRVAAQGLR